MAGDTVPFADLSLQWDPIRVSVLKKLDELFMAGAFSQGPWAGAFEQEMAEYLGVRHAVGLNSGSSALHLAMIAANVQRGDKVLVPAQTFIGTLWGILYQGAIPVLCDVDADTANIDPQEIERRMQPGVKAIIAVHLFGQPADLAPILDLASGHGIAVVEDVAQAVAAEYRGRRLGAIGAMGCFSFYPGKNLGAAGEAGMVTTDDDDLATRLRALRNHGQRERYVHAEVGYNYRMDGIQGLVLSHKLRLIDSWTAQRRQIAHRYLDQLAGLPIELPQVRNGDHVWHLFVIRSPRRDELRGYLAERGVETGLHYPVPIHRQPCLSHLEMDRNSFPQADRWATQGLSLPVFAGMSDSQQGQVIDAVRSFFRQE